MEVNKHQLSKFEAAVMNSPWGRSRLARAKEIAYTLFTPGHKFRVRVRVTEVVEPVLVL